MGRQRDQVVNISEKTNINKLSARKNTGGSLYITAALFADPIAGNTKTDTSVKNSAINILTYRNTTDIMLYYIVYIIFQYWR